MTAGPDVKVTVDGARELRRAMKAAGEDLRQLTAVHRRVGSIVTAAAAAQAPRRTGRLAGSVRPSATRTRARVAVGRASVPYAGPIHWGWPARNIEANPFIADAARSTEPEWTRVYRSEVDALIEKVARAT